MIIKVDVYSKKHGITTIEIDDSMIEELAISEFLDCNSSSEEWDNVVIDKVEI